jgi:hypothetical protein
MNYGGKSCYINGHYTDNACTLGMLPISRFPRCLSWTDVL